MGFLFKLLIFLAVVFVGGSFLINQVPSLKEKALEIVNPSIKEGKLLARLGSNFENLDILVKNAASARNSAEIKSKMSQSEAIIKSSVKILEEAQKINQKQQEAGFLQKAASKIIETFIDKTPFPADHLTPAQAGAQNAGVNLEALPTCKP